MGIAPMNFGMPNVIDLYGLNETNHLHTFLQSLNIDNIEIDDIDDNEPDFPTPEVNHRQINFTLEELVDIDDSD